MTATTWIGGSDDFNNPADWSNGVPGAGVDATIYAMSAAPIIVTYSGGADVANTLNTQYAGLAMSAGSLVLQYSSTLQNSLNAFTQTGGLLEFQNGESLNQTSSITGTGSAVEQTGGTIQVDQGTLILNGNSAFAGTITGGLAPLGGGTLVLTGGDTYNFNKGAALTIGALTLQQYDTDMVLGASLTYKGVLTEQNGTTLSLGGHTLTLNDVLAASDQIAGLVSGGILLNAGTMSLDGGATIASGATLENRHTLLLSNFAEYVQLGNGGDGTAILQNDAGGVVRLQAGGTMISGAGDAEIINAGLFQASAQNVTTVVQAAMTNSGTLSAGKLATLALAGPLTNSGTISGAGTLLAYNSFIELDAGSVVASAAFGLSGSSTLSLGLNLAYGGYFFETASGASASLALNGYTLTLTGAASFTDPYGVANVTGAGELLLEGRTTLADFQLGATAQLDNGGVVSQTGLVQIGDGSGAQAGIVNEAGASWVLAGPVSITNGSNGQSGFVNQGSLNGAANSGNSTISALFTNSGTLSLGAGSALHIGGLATNSGVVSGAGTLEIAGGDLTLSVGTTLGVANFGFYAESGGESGTLTLGANIAYGGNFSDMTEYGLTVIDLDSHDLRLAGAASFAQSNGTVLLDGPGTLTLARTALLSGLTVGGGATVSNSGTVTQSGLLQLGDSTPTADDAVNAASGVWNLTTDMGISPDATDSSLFTNAGLLEKTGGVSSSTIAVAFRNTGTLASSLAGGSLLFTGGGTFSGTLEGVGAIDFGGGMPCTVAGGTTLTASGLGIVGYQTDLTLAGNETYAGTLTLANGNTLTLGGKSLQLSGTATLAGTLNGAGSVRLCGHHATAVTDYMVLGGAVTLQDNGAVIAQQAGCTIGNGAASTANLQLLAGSLYEITGDVGIASNGLGAIANAGLFEKAAGTGISVVSPAFSNSGTVASLTGTLQFNAGFTNGGRITAAGGSAVAFEASLVTAQGGTGTISLSNGGSALFAGYVDGGETLQFADGSPNLATLAAPGMFNASIAGFSGQDTIDLKNAQAFVSAYSGNGSAGTLTLSQIVNGVTSTVASLNFLGNYNMLDFVTSSDGGNGTLLQVAGGFDPHAPDLAVFDTPRMPILPETSAAAWVGELHHVAW